MGNTEMSIAILAIVASISAALTIIAAFAYRRRHNRILLFLIFAFIVFTVKNVFAAVSLSLEWIPHEHLEVYEGLFDLVTVALLIAPYFSR